MLAPLVKYDENVTVPKKTKRYLVRVTGKGKIYLITFLVNPTKKASLHINIDGLVYDLPSIEWFVDIGLSIRNRVLFCHVVDDTNNKYGMLLEKKFEFEKEFELYILNEDEDNDLTVLKYFVFGEVES